MSSKKLAAFVSKATAIPNAPAKFTESVVEGSRILPTKVKDAEYEMRLDAGRFDSETKKLNVVLQVNSQAKSPVLKEWVKKNTTHGKLAVASFDTAATDKNAEYKRMLEELREKGKKNLG
ncbi:hypothetical protein BDZ85DRAFT_320809 [Elsinoe ampelina]|uniref:Uncharacterized protein n=1 Tax=Elsinoe ampelina TaxID=302913 RepID=A0A6A6G7A3_9PEZI|nr:hypothetical protein BDZ85DRAFT_320809 [Elsinoe ampelina]